MLACVLNCSEAEALQRTASMLGLLQLPTCLSLGYV